MSGIDEAAQTTEAARQRAAEVRKQARDAKLDVRRTRWEYTEKWLLRHEALMKSLAARIDDRKTALADHCRPCPECVAPYEPNCDEGHRLRTSLESYRSQYRSAAGEYATFTYGRLPSTS